jgi:hypothetical protein
MVVRVKQWQDVTWREFELYVEDCLTRALDESTWRVLPQRARSYKDNNGGENNFRLDFHVAERRQGGISVVVDAKHYKSSYLNKSDVIQVEQYRRSCRASEAIIVLSPITKFSDDLIDFCFDEVGMSLLVVNRNIVSNLRNVFIEIENGYY